MPQSPFAVSKDSFSTFVIADGFTIPYGIAILGDNDYFITDRIGKMFHYKDGGINEVSGVPSVEAVKHRKVIVFGGLMDISLHPNYLENSWLYLTYVSLDYLAKVARCKVENDSITHFEIIFTTQNQNLFGNGMRMVWQDDQHFFLNVGGTSYSRTSNPILVAQDINSCARKIHRIRDDGSIPPDNPIFDGFTAPKTIWSYGHRDVQGLYYDSTSKELLGAEHGPRGGDELNVIKKGGNYGWPIFSLGVDYSGETVSTISKDSAAVSTILPEHHWTIISSKKVERGIGPSSLLKVEGSNIADWNNYFLIGSLRSRRLLKFDRATRTTYGLDVEGRVRTVKQLPGGDIIAMIEQSKSEALDGKIIRITN